MVGRDAMSPMEIAIEDLRRSDFEDEETSFDDEEPTQPRLIIPNLLPYGW
jgi:hypothetical protein